MLTRVTYTKICVVKYLHVKCKFNLFDGAFCKFYRRVIEFSTKCKLSTSHLVSKLHGSSIRDDEFFMREILEGNLLKTRNIIIYYFSKVVIR